MVANPKSTFKVNKISSKDTHMPFGTNWIRKFAIKFEEKAIRKTEIRKKQVKKRSKFQLKSAQKQATRKS